MRKFVICLQTKLYNVCVKHIPSSFDILDSHLGLILIIRFAFLGLWRVTGPVEHWKDIKISYPRTYLIYNWYLSFPRMWTDWVCWRYHNTKYFLWTPQTVKLKNYEQPRLYSKQGMIRTKSFWFVYIYCERETLFRSIFWNSILHCF